MTHMLLPIIIGLLPFSLTIPALAYQSVPVTNGGTITGKVVLTGQEPPPLAFSLVTNNDTEFCGRISTGTGWRLLDEFQVAPDGGLQYAVVFLEGINSGKPFSKDTPARVMVEDCVFAPWILVVKDPTNLSISSTWILSSMMFRSMKRHRLEPRSCYTVPFA